MFLQILVASCCLTLQSGQAITTDFLPSRDLPNFQNRVAPGFSKFGMCNGIDELAAAYREVTKNNPNALPLRDVIASIQRGRGEPYLAQLMATATNMASNKGYVSYFPKRNPNDLVAGIIANLSQTHAQQALLLTPARGPNHRVSVYEATPTSTGWILRISDIDHPGDAEVDHVTLLIDAKTGKLTTQVLGRPAETWVEGGIIPLPARPADQYIHLIEMGLQGKPIKEIQSTLHATPYLEVPSPKATMNIQKDPKTGGVLIRFDPALFTGTIDEAKLADLNERAQAFLKSDAGGAAILTLEPTVRHISLVSFGTLSPGGMLGGLTRVLGFVVKADGSTYLAGLKEPGQAPIPSEWLAVALQSQYSRGLSPFISLDPNPDTYSGPQNVRIGDIPDNLRSSSFIKAMLDADYLMKQIILDKVEPKVEGFTSWVDRTIQAGRGGAVRMWFTPYSVPAADSFIYRHEGSVAVLFRSQVSVLSEREKAEGDSGFAEGAKDDVTEEAARDMTDHLDEFSSMYPEFHRLRGVFDVSKLAASWRALKVKPNGLEPWLSFTPPNAGIPESYPGIGPDQTKDGKAMVSGGAIAKARFKQSSTVETERLAPMIAESEKPEVVIELPATLPLGKSSEAAFEAANLLAVAKGNHGEGQVEQALVMVDQVLTLDPDDEDALTFKAILLGFLKRYPEAIALLDKLVPTNPSLAGVRAVLKASTGDYPGALSDARDAEKDSTGSESTLAACIAARILALDVDGASATLHKLRALSPGYPTIVSMDAQIDLIRYLGPEKARARMDLMAQVPLPISLAMLQSPLAPGGMDAYKGALDLLEGGTMKVPESLFIPERLRLVMACATLTQLPSATDLAMIGKGTDKLISDHPDWPSGYLARFCVLVAIDASVDLIKGTLEKYAELEVKSDPVLMELQLVMRVPRLAPHLAAMGSIDPSVKPELRTAMAALSVELTPGLPGRPFLALLAANPRVDAVALSLAISRGVIFESDADVTRVLDQMTGTVEAIPPTDPAFLPALDYCADALQVVKPGSAEYTRMIHRAMTLAGAGSPSRFYLPVAAKFRSQIWLRVAFESVRPILGPGSAAIKEMDPLAAQMDRLLQPESAKDSTEDVSKTLTALANGLNGFVHALRAAASGSLATTRSQFGEQAADVTEFCLAQMQSQMHFQDRGELAKLVSLHPGIENTSGYAALVAVSQDMSSGVMLSESEDAVWKRILTGIKTQYDGLSIQELISALMTFGAKPSAQLSTYMIQCKVKTEMGTSLSGN